MAERPAVPCVAPAPGARSRTEERLRELTTALGARAHRYELERAWPRESLADYARLGGWRWGIPPEHGGEALFFCVWSASELVRAGTVDALGE